VPIVPGLFKQCVARQDVAPWAGRTEGNARKMGTKSWVADVTRLVEKTRGPLLGPDDRGYEDSRRVFNAMIDRSPALILRAADRTDVVHGVDFARRHDLPISIKGGGHSVAGSAVCDDGLMLDLSGMRGITVDPDRRTAVAEPGLTLGQFDLATAVHGLATPLGVVSMTGLAGLTLGGGLGWLAGKHGLACDNLLAADVVTADGELRTVNAEQCPDLFWALRGGGGNFGVVVSFSYRLHPVHTVLAGRISYPPHTARQALAGYHELAGSFPDELTTAVSVGRDPDGAPVVSVAVCWAGDPRHGEKVLRPLREFAPPDADGVGPMPYPAWQSAADAEFPFGRQHYWKSGYLTQLSTAAIDTILEFTARAPSPYTGVGFQQLTGVASRVDPAATAFAHRGRRYDFLILSQWDNPSDTPANIAWTRSFHAAMSPFLETGVYVNNLGTGEDPARVRAAYGSNYQRLASVKADYDPANVFHLNHNIRPTNAESH
jgi:FAD/FMN-containing dehydrogenase